MIEIRDVRRITATRDGNGFTLAFHQPNGERCEVAVEPHPGLEFDMLANFCEDVQSILFDIAADALPSAAEETAPREHCGYDGNAVPEVDAVAFGVGLAGVL